MLVEAVELRGVFAPLEVIGQLDTYFSRGKEGPALRRVTGAQGWPVLADVAHEDGEHADVVVVPGYRGARSRSERGAPLLTRVVGRVGPVRLFGLHWIRSTRSSSTVRRLSSYLK